jgi:hypothetical protein
LRLQGHHRLPDPFFSSFILTTVRLIMYRADKQTYPGLDVVGWYATGASPSSFDLEIQRQMAVLNEAPVFLLLDGMASTSMTSAVHQKDLPVRLFESGTCGKGKKVYQGYNYWECYFQVPKEALS